MPRSLKDPVGFWPSTLMCTSAPTALDSAGAGTSGVPPSPRLSRASVSENGRWSLYSARTPRHWCAMASFSFEAQDGVDAQHRGRGGEHVQGGGHRGFEGPMRGDADVGLLRRTLRVGLLTLDQPLEVGRASCREGARDE